MYIANAMFFLTSTGKSIMVFLPTSLPPLPIFLLLPPSERRKNDRWVVNSQKGGGQFSLPLIASSSLISI